VALAVFKDNHGRYPGNVMGRASKTPDEKKAATMKSLLLFSSCEFVVGRAGFEPATNGLKVRCSTS